MRAGGSNKGFTIVELLIVIVVIGILAAIIIVAYGGVTGSARNSKRASDLEAIQKALELYHADNNGYPLCGSSSPSLSPYSFTTGTATSCLTAALVPKYMPSIPIDPTNSGSYQYWYGTGYQKTGTYTYTFTTPTDNYILGEKQDLSTGPYYSGWSRTDLTVLLGSNG